VLAARGYRVSLLARSEAVHAVARELGGIATLGSVQEGGDLERLVQQTIAAYGRIDAVVNNTGHPAKGELLALTDEQWQEGFQLILRSVIQMARLVTPIMREQGGGCLVNLSSYAAVRPELERPVSSVFRAALLAWTRVYADYCAPHGIRVNSVLPGFIQTGPPAGVHGTDIPLGRYGDLEEIGKVVAFLLSPESSYMTGQSLLVDGGMVRTL
jgi:NAD(P)-dependent dehydrogenase (short-subunit alcohol dehydrogenase family)